MMNGLDSDAFLSLAQHFDSPANYRGTFGWICGYSADAAFLDDALERFTQATHAQRAYEGRVRIALILDPGNPAIPFADAPGIAHLPLLDARPRPFVLLHAKVGLLGFRHETEPDRWLIRLIVSTGNWTRQTLEQSLDLAWCLDVRSEDLEGRNAKIALPCSDVAAAWSLLQWLSEFVDRRLLNGDGGSRMAESAHAHEALAAWLSQCERAAAQTAPRFFDNRQASLLAQLPDKIKATGRAVKRNYLAMGSGFYEALIPVAIDRSVPFEIRNALRTAGLLTGGSEVDLFVNPASCQGIAAAIDTVTAAGITVRAARTPSAVFQDGSGRALHAKFLFSANSRAEATACSSPWLYLGSGNLTSQGFTRAAGAGGNLESGVVFDLPALPWYADPKLPQRGAIENLLPVQWAEQLRSADEPSPGEGFPAPPDDYLAGPVAWLIWQGPDVGGELIAPQPQAADYLVLDTNRNPCNKRGDGFLWPWERPRQVAVCWQGDDGRARECLIPVIDSSGRIAGTPLPALKIEDAWWQLADFPMPPHVDDEDEHDDQEQHAKHRSEEGGDQKVPDSYPIRRMMELIESIAAKQTDLASPDWPAWCARLEQTLLQAAGDRAVEAFVALGLNPLSPLRARPFRPGFAESTDTEHGQRYETLLARIEDAWGVAALASIGGPTCPE